MGEFVRTQLPDPATYYDGEGLTFKGPGKWKTTRCDFHGGSDSMRINVESGAFVCMACGVKGGDVLAHHMQVHGLEFIEAARALGAYVDDGRPHRGQSKPTTLPARSAIQVVREDVLVCALVAIDASHGKAISNTDRQSVIEAAARVEFVLGEFAA
jgi:CHC2 zinc finger